MKYCIQHNYILVNNRYLNGKPVIEGGEWITEKKCQVCGELFPQVEADRIKSLTSRPAMTEIKGLNK